MRLSERVPSEKEDIEQLRKEFSSEESSFGRKRQNGTRGFLQQCLHDGIFEIAGSIYS